jgi:excisionase family DNA binding protein
MAEPDELLTVAEIAATLKMNQQAIRNWTEGGYAPAIRIGRRVRVRRSAFDALLEASYTRKSQTSPGVWDGEVPAPVAPDDRVEDETAPSTGAGDAPEAEHDADSAQGPCRRPRNTNVQASATGTLARSRRSREQRDTGHGGVPR